MAVEDADAVASFEGDLVIVLEVGESVADKAVTEGVVFPCDARTLDESGPSSLKVVDLSGVDEGIFVRPLVLFKEGFERWKHGDYASGSCFTDGALDDDGVVEDVTPGQSACLATPESGKGLEG